MAQIVPSGKGRKTFQLSRKNREGEASAGLFSWVKNFLTGRRKDSVEKFEQERLNTIFLSAPIAVCTMDGPDHIFSVVNDAYYDLLGGRPEILGRPAREVLPELEGQGFFSLLDRVYRKGRTLRAREIRVDDRFLDFVYQPRKDGEGTIKGVMFIATDVTDQVRSREWAEREVAVLRDEVSARDEFISMASHELKTPLTCLKLHLELTQRRLPSALNGGQVAERVAHSIDSSNQQVARLNGLVDDLMDLTRIRTGKMAYAFEHRELAPLVREVASHFEGQSKRVGSEIRVDAPWTLMAFFDYARMEQVLVNLISNALKYAPACLVEVRLRRAEKDVILEVRDEGPGIAADLHERIFDRFERAEDSASALGLGLGLYIVREIVKTHRGSIELESELGKGALFRVRFPHGEI